MTTIQVSTESEINKAIFELAILIQALCKEASPQSIVQLPQLIQSAAELINVSKNFID